MDDEELKEYQDPDTWEEIEDGLRPPVNPTRVIVSVAFPRHDFDLISDAADVQGIKLTEFIHKAAIEHARQLAAESVAVSLSGDTRSR